MIDRDKVIGGLDCHRIDNNHRINCADCPYYVDDGDHIQCVNDLHDDAIVLLKEQEPQPVKVVKNVYNHEFYYCPRCDRSFYGPWVKPKFCDRCGQAVKWE